MHLNKKIVSSYPTLNYAKTNIAMVTPLKLLRATLLEGGGDGSNSPITNPAAAVYIKSNDTNLQIITSNQVAFSIDNNQNVIVGKEDIVPTKKLTVSAPMGDCVDLINETTGKKVSLTVGSSGSLDIDTFIKSVNFGINKLFIGGERLYIDDECVISTANQLNYNNVTPGIATALKSLVVNDQRSIYNINSLSAVSLTGTLQTSSQPNISDLNNVNISNLSIGGNHVLSTATELNYLSGVVPGIIKEGCAIVLDSSKSLRNLGAIEGTTITGTLLSHSQHNITSLGDLTSLNVLGSIGIGTVSPTRTLEIVATTPSIGLYNGIYRSDISIDGNGNLRISPECDIVITNDKNLVFSGNGSIIGLDRIVSNSVFGTIQTPNQPLITSIGNLVSLVITGDIQIGNVNVATASQRVLINEPTGQMIKLYRTSGLFCDISINSMGDLELRPTGDVKIPNGKSLFMTGQILGVSSISANTLSGTLTTSEQLNITSVGTLTSLTSSGSIVGNSITASYISGILQTANQPNITSIGTLSSLIVSTSLTSESITASTLSGTLLTQNQNNITSVGTLQSLNVSTSITCNEIFSNQLKGELITAIQPNITSVGVLTSLLSSGTITGNKIIGSSLTGTLTTVDQPNITSIGILNSLTVSGTIISNNMISQQLTGTLITPSQPNITSIGTLNNLNVESTIVCQTLSSNTITGVLQSPNQTNIKSIGTLLYLGVDGPIGIGMQNPICAIDINTSTLSTTPMIRIDDGSIKATIGIGSYGLVINTTGNSITLGSGVGLRFVGGDITGLSNVTTTTLTGLIQTSSQPNITSVGKLDYVDTDFIGIGTTHSQMYRLSLLNETGKFITLSTGLDSFFISVLDDDYTISTSTGRVALDSSVDLVFNGGTIIGLTDLYANTLSGTIQTTNQPNITRVGTLSSLVVNGEINANNIVSNNANIQTLHIGGNISIGGTLDLSSLSLNSLTSLTGLFNSNVPATTTTNGGTLTVIGGAAFSQNIIVGSSITIGNTTINENAITALSSNPGIVDPNKFIMSDSNKDLTGFRNLTSTNFYGAIKTCYQPNITTVGNLTNLNVDGYVGVGTQSPAKRIHINSPTGDCLRLSNLMTSYLDISVDTTGVSTISASGTSIKINPIINTNQIILGNSTNTTAPMEVGYTTFSVYNSYAYNLSTNSKGIYTYAAGTTPPSYNYSIRALGRILCTQSVDVMSDRRTKKNIEALDDDFCSTFIAQTTPVSFNWVDGDNNKAFGYIAQDLIKAGFHELVNLIPDKDVKEEIEEDGFINPDGVKFTVTYQHIIPIIAKNQKRLMQENTELKEKLDTILDMLSSLR